MFTLGLSTKLIIAGVVLALFSGAIAYWHHDIESAVYERVYAKQVNEALKEKQDEIDRLNRLNSLAQDSVNRAVQEKQKSDQTNAALIAKLKTMNLTGQVSPGLSSALDAVQQMGRAQ